MLERWELLWESHPSHLPAAWGAPARSLHQDCPLGVLFKIHHHVCPAWARGKALAQSKCKEKQIPRCPGCSLGCQQDWELLWPLWAAKDTLSPTEPEEGSEWLFQWKLGWRIWTGNPKLAPAQECMSWKQIKTEIKRFPVLQAANCQKWLNYEKKPYNMLAWSGRD